MMTIPLTSHSQSVKRQLEEVLKDTKILCELEPFVKKWVISEEFLPTAQVQPSQENDISKLFKNYSNSSKDPKEREKLFRKAKEIMTSKSLPNPGGAEGNWDDHLSLVPLSHQDSDASLGDQYDRELECTLSALKEIEEMNAVTETDIEHLKSGLGKPDGPDLHKSNLQEWKHIFLEHWLNLDRYFGEIENKRLARMSKHKGLLPEIVSSSSKDAIPPSTSSSSSLKKASLHGHFMTRKCHKDARPKTSANCVVPAPPSTPPSPPTPRQSLLSFSESSRDRDASKMTSSARGGVAIKDLENYYHQQRERIRKCVINRNIQSDWDKARNSNKTGLMQKLQKKVGNPSVRPSSAIPFSSSTSPYLTAPLPQMKLTSKTVDNNNNRRK